MTPVLEIGTDIDMTKEKRDMRKIETYTLANHSRLNLFLRLGWTLKLKTNAKMKKTEFRLNLVKQ